MTVAKTERLYFVDVARAYAIALALFTHGMTDFGGWESGLALEPLRFVVRSATPLFMFMFGMMLELAYARRAEREGLQSVVPRLLKRAWQCYLGYALTAVAMVIGGYVGLRGAFQSLYAVGDTHYSGILLIYAVALVVAPSLLWLRLRFGSRPLFLLLCFIWGVAFFVTPIYENTSFGLFTQWMGRFLGVGSYHVGPSAFHAFTFILVGMLVARGLDGWHERGLSRFYLYAGVVLAISLGITLYLVATRGLADTYTSYSNYDGFRSHNQIGFFSIGLIQCILTLVALSVLIPRDGLPEWTRIPLRFGQASLLSFAVGNIALSLIPPGSLRGAFGAAAPLVAIAYVLAILALVNWREFAGMAAPRLSRAVAWRKAP